MAIRCCFGERALIQRCQVHKARNVTEHLPESERPFLRRKLEAAWRQPDAEAAERALTALARALERSHPGAAKSLREGLPETLTVTRLGLSAHDALWRTLRSTNPVEQSFSVCRVEARNDASMAVKADRASPPRRTRRRSGQRRGSLLRRLKPVDQLADDLGGGS